MRTRILHKAAFRLRALWTQWLASPARKAWWRLQGMRIGPATIVPHMRATWPHQVQLGRRCLLEPDIYFKFDGIWAPGPCIRIGDQSFIGKGCEFNIRVGIDIGSHGLIASGCVFVDHDHDFKRRDIPIGEQHDTALEQKIVISDDVWIGANCVVTKGVTIGLGAIVGAGSVVTRSIGAYEIWAGTPARFIRMRP